MTKKCSKCGGIKSTLDCFTKESKSLDGFCRRCKDCKNEYKRKWRKENPEKERTGTHVYYAKNRDKIRAQQEEYVKENLDKVRQIKNKYQKKYVNEGRIDIEKERARGRKNRERMSDYYIVSLLVSQIGINRDKISSELIQVKREHLKAKRIHNKYLKEAQL